MNTAEKIIASLPKKLSGPSVPLAFRWLWVMTLPAVAEPANISRPAGTPVPLSLSVSFW